MNLRQIIEDIENLSDELVIFASRNGDWNPEGLAALVMISDLETVGTSLEELFYFLEVETGKEVLDVWKEWRNGQEPSQNERIQALMYYASNDAYLEL